MAISNYDKLKSVMDTCPAKPGDVVYAWTGDDMERDCGILGGFSLEDGHRYFVVTSADTSGTWYANVDIQSVLYDPGDMADVMRLWADAREAGKDLVFEEGVLYGIADTADGAHYLVVDNGAEGRVGKLTDRGGSNVDGLPVETWNARLGAAGAAIGDMVYAWDDGDSAREGMLAAVDVYDCYYYVVRENGGRWYERVRKHGPIVYGAGEIAEVMRLWWKAREAGEDLKFAEGELVGMDIRASKPFHVAVVGMDYWTDVLNETV